MHDTKDPKQCRAWPFKLMFSYIIESGAAMSIQIAKQRWSRRGLRLGWRNPIRWNRDTRMQQRHCCYVDNRMLLLALKPRRWFVAAIAGTCSHSVCATSEHQDLHRIFGHSQMGQGPVLLKLAVCTCISMRRRASN